jgi:hypothetical protein
MIESPIVGRTAKRYAVVSPADFSLGPGREIAALPLEATPYCADFDSQSLLCVTAPGILDHPFLYQAQRQQAKTVIRVALAELAEEDVTPMLIFSPGRCGSTLLYRILKAAALPCVSEPDYFSQAATSFARRGRGAMDRYRRPMRAATGLLAASLASRSPVIKLRHHCLDAPLLISGAFAACKIIFLLRDHREWALSVKHVSPPGLTTRMALATFKGALEALDRLANNLDVLICHYRDAARADSGYVQKLVSFLGQGTDVAQECLLAILQQDSQAGTNIAERRSAADRRDDALFLDEFERLWETERPAAIIERRGLAGLI